MPVFRYPLLSVKLHNIFMESILFIFSANMKAKCFFELGKLRLEAVLLPRLSGSNVLVFQVRTKCQFVLASPAVSCMSGSSNLESFRDGRQVAISGNLKRNPVFT